MDAKELYLLSVKENGISQEEYSKLSREDKEALERREGGRYWLAKHHREGFKVCLTGGVFDVLHIGHILTLQEAKKLADLLVVVVATDERVEKLKGKKPIHPSEYRRAMVSCLKPVDLAIIGSKDIMETFWRVGPDIVAFGYDQKPFPLPSPCKSVHLVGVRADERMAKTSRIIRELGL
ncbi:MAG: adenylyltransferase/cytidyltransferase family protein [Candidatus Micrarchaeota archaeon]|nr:adenylyltransferase/cytidyltransferase family protein [Candidatus Micrarchaeota archaeon]